MTIAPVTPPMAPLSALPVLTEPPSLPGVTAATGAAGIKVTDFSQILANQAAPPPGQATPTASPPEPGAVSAEEIGQGGPDPAGLPQTGKILPPALPVEPKPGRPGNPAPGTPMQRLPNAPVTDPVPGARSPRDAAAADDVEAAPVEGPVAIPLSDPAPPALPREAPATPMTPVQPVQAGTHAPSDGRTLLEPPTPRQAAAAPTILPDRSPAPDRLPVEAAELRASAIAPAAPFTPGIQKNGIPEFNILLPLSNPEPEPSIELVTLFSLTSPSRTVVRERSPLRTPFAPSIAALPIDAAPVTTAGAPQTSSPIPTVPHDFAALVERLSAAREAVQPQAVAIAVSHAEFGPVRLHFRHEDGALNVAMVNADPDFARAIAAAPPVQPSATLADSATPQQRGPEARPGDTSGGQPRGQAQSERRDERGPRTNPSQSRPPLREGGTSYGIFA